MICEHNRNCHTFGGCQQASVPNPIHFRLGCHLDGVPDASFNADLTKCTVPSSAGYRVAGCSVDDTAGSLSSTNIRGIHGWSSSSSSITLIGLGNGCLLPNVWSDHTHDKRCVPFVCPTLLTNPCLVAGLVGPFRRPQLVCHHVSLITRTAGHTLSSR